MTRQLTFLFLILPTLVMGQEGNPVDMIPIIPTNPLPPPQPPHPILKPQPATPPTNPQQPPAQPTNPKSATEGGVDVSVLPIVPRDIPVRPAKDDAGTFMATYHMEALQASRSWEHYWNSPDVAFIKVAAPPPMAGVPQGAVLHWHRDALGNPMITLRATVMFPRLRAPDAITEEEPLSAVPVTISQAIIFIPRREGWLASASPMMVTVAEGDKNLVLLPLTKGQGSWRSFVGRGGLYIDNFVGAGLTAARTEIYQYFRDEEVRLFLTKNTSDVVFYFRQ